MLNIARLLGALALTLGMILQAAAQPSAFTYQGRLTENAQSANGYYRFQFLLADAESGGNYLGPALTNESVLVTNGLFTVTLDFGAGVFDGAARWLEIALSTNGGAQVTVLSPRQLVTAAPYAVTAASASKLTGTLPASQLTGVISTAQLPGVVLTNDTNGALNLSGAFAGDGAGLSNLPNIWMPRANTNVLLLSGFGSNFVTLSLNPEDGVGAGPTIDASLANGTYFWNTASQSYTNATNGYGLFNAAGAFPVLTNAQRNQLPDDEGFGEVVSSVGVTSGPPGWLWAPSTNWFVGSHNGADTYPGARSDWQTNLVPVFGGGSLASWLALPQLSQSNAYQGSFAGDLSGSSNLSGALSFTVSNDLSAGVILSSELAYVTGIPPQEAIVASWAPQPFLGYNPWYDYAVCSSLRAHTTSNFLAAAATQWATNGMLGAGWNWITIDDTWQAPQRVNGHLAEDPARFPGGIKGLVDYLHQLGFKVMVYTSFPGGTCCGYPGTGLADIGKDVTYFAQCGFDAIKVDSCGAPFPGTYGLEEAGTRLFASAIHLTGRPMALYMNYPAPPPYPQYLRYQDNCFSVWADGAIEFPSGLEIFTNADMVLNYHTNFMAPGHYTFGGAVVCAALGLPELTNVMSFLALEQCTIPCGMPRNGSQMAVLTNSEVLAIANDPGVVPPRRVWDDGQLAAWIKPLGSASGSTNVLALINRTTNSATLGVAWVDLGISDKMTVRDLWEQRTLGDYTDGFSNSIPAEAVRLYKLWPQDSHPPYTGTLSLGTNTVVIRNGVIIDVH